MRVAAAAAAAEARVEEVAAAAAAAVQAAQEDKANAVRRATLIAEAAAKVRGALHLALP